MQKFFTNSVEGRFNLPMQQSSMAEYLLLFYRWIKQGVIAEINMALNSRIRIQEGREATPSLCCADSQSIKIAPMIFEDKGLDGNKRSMAVNGRYWWIPRAWFGQFLYM